MPRYYACSASDKTEDWPVWFVADSQRDGLNVTAELIRALLDESHVGNTLLPKRSALSLAEIANKV